MLQEQLLLLSTCTSVRRSEHFVLIAGRVERRRSASRQRDERACPEHEKRRPCRSARSVSAVSLQIVCPRHDLAVFRGGHVVVAAKHAVELADVGAADLLDNVADAVVGMHQQRAGM